MFRMFMFSFYLCADSDEFPPPFIGSECHLFLDPNSNSNIPSPQLASTLSHSPQHSFPLSQNQFLQAVEKINSTISNNLACGVTKVLEIFCCPCTLGGSLLLSTLFCHSMAVRSVQREIDLINQDMSLEFPRKNIIWRFIKEGSSSSSVSSFFSYVSLIC
jgi:hypothetical protein